MTILCYWVVNFQISDARHGRAWLVGWKIAWDAWATLTQEKEWVIHCSEGWWFNQCTCWRYWARCVKSNYSEWAGGTSDGSLCQQCMTVCVNGKVAGKTNMCSVNTGMKKMVIIVWIWAVASSSVCVLCQLFRFRDIYKLIITIWFIYISLPSMFTGYSSH